MPRTPDRSPGAMIEDDEIIFQPNVSSPSGPGAFNYNGTSYVMQDAEGNFNPRNDEKVKVSAGDTTPGFLESKLVAGSNVSLTKQNVGADETLEVAVPGVSFAATCCGQILISTDGITFAPQSIMAAASGGLMTNDKGLLLVVG